MRGSRGISSGPGSATAVLSRGCLDVSRPRRGRRREKDSRLFVRIRSYPTLPRQWLTCWMLNDRPRLTGSDTVVCTPIHALRTRPVSIRVSWIFLRNQDFFFVRLTTVFFFPFLLLPASSFSLLTLLLLNLRTKTSGCIDILQNLPNLRNFMAQ